MNTAAFLAKQARARGSAPALSFGDQHQTYTELHERVLAIAGNLLGLGLRKGDRVAFVLANGPECVEVLYGCFAAGLVVVPVNARLHPKEMAYIVENSGARVLVHGVEYDEGIKANLAHFGPQLSERVCLGADGGTMPYSALLDAGSALERHLDLEPEDLSWLFYTSGTTGRPKGATWNHRTIRTLAMNHLADVHNIAVGEVVLHVAPMSHGGGIVGLPAMARGAHQVIATSASFNPEQLFADVERLRVGHIAFMAPTMIIKMLQDFVPNKYDLSSLQAITYGGAPMHVTDLKAAVAAFGPIFAQIFGQGEAPMTISGLPAAEHAELIARGDRRIGSAGRIRTDVECRIVDADDNEVGPGVEGEVCARGDVVMVGYWNNPEATAETLRGGWLHTGDIGMIDEDGYLFILDRTKDMIISGGNNVYPREVEEVIVTHPAVSAVCVLGIPDEYWGEAVHAVVVLEPGASLGERELIEFCAESLAGYKKPKAVDFVDELPVSAYGKVERRTLREQYWAGHETRIGGGAAR
ncbi:MAG TPA: long-chain fatty acid--CoA ligase [Solirubrobacteraceae bacterium]|jgi:acyl-CoA synthetase (AMP-forming)/AMP-acid ligase II|nr:long-chain fatty acid--CoA ligase [Solirubrobacteraceae bacterium]